MRDRTIIAMQQQNAQRDGRLIAQHEFLKTRQEAFELAIKASTLKDRIQWIFWPLDLLQVVDAIQLKLLDRAQAKMEKAVVSSKIVKASSIQVVPG